MYGWLGSRGSPQGDDEVLEAFLLGALFRGSALKYSPEASYRTHPCSKSCIYQI